jgi:hypothetical protein
MRFPTLVLAIILISLTLPVVSSQPIKVEEISNYVIDVNVSGDGVHVKNVITLKNTVDKPLVPGIGELRLQKATPEKIGIIPIPFTEKRSAIKVEKVKAYTDDGRNINVRVIYKENYTVIEYQIWYPVEPKGELTFVIEYFSPDMVEKGILFKDVSFPVGADVDIRNIEVKFNSDWNLVYVENTRGAIPAKHMTFFTAEFSILPLPNVGIKWSVTFWTAVTAVAFVSAVFIRLRTKTKEGEKGEKSD